jgi:hypothetical protein
VNLRELYNYKACLNELSSHNWTSDPYACLMGAQDAGKTRLINEFIKKLVDERHLILSFDGREHVDEPQLVSRAVASAALDEMKQSRVRLSSGGAQVIFGGEYTQSNISVNLDKPKTWRWYAPWRPTSSTKIETRGALFPDLLADIEAVQRDIWVVLDHWDEASNPALELVSHIAQRLRLQPRLRLVIVKRVAGSGNPLTEAPALSGSTPIVVTLQPLTREQFGSWAGQLGLDLRDRDVEDALFTLTKGAPGAAWEIFAQLSMDQAWASQRG